VTAEKIMIVRDGGTSWWVPLAVGLGVAVVAAAASYAATWRFKKRDVERENAFRAVDIVDEAEQIAARQERWEAAGGAGAVLRLLQEARVRAQPLRSRDLDERFQAAMDYLSTFMFGRQDRQQPGGWKGWLREATANIREGLVPYLAAPRLLPSRRDTTLERSFPTLAELQAMPHGADGEELIDALVAWKEARA
jgi:hypothetical protein